MRYTLIPSLVLASIGGTYGLSPTTMPMCVSACTKSDIQDASAAILRTLCNDATMQRALLSCLLRSCEIQHYGPALAYTISTCSSFSASINPLYPVEITASNFFQARELEGNPIAHHFEKGSIPNSRVLDHDFSVAMACQAGTDGIVTILPAGLSPSVSQPPNRASLPGGHREPMNPDGEPQLEPAMTLTTESNFSPDICTTCMTKHGNTLSTAVAFTTPSSQQSTVAATSISNGVFDLNKSLTIDATSHDCSTHSSSIQSSLQSSTASCGCSTKHSSSSSLSTQTTSSCTTSELAAKTMSVSSLSLSVCSTSVAILTTTTPAFSTTTSTTQLKMSKSTLAVMSNSSTPCASSDIVGVNTNTPTQAPRLTLLSNIITTSQWPKLHVPGKPSQSCSFPNSTTVQLTTVEAFTDFSNVATTTECTTTSSPQALTPSTSDCTTSSLGSSPQSTLLTTLSPLTTSPTTISIQVSTTTPSLLEYTTSYLPPAYTSPSVLNVYAYAGSLHQYGSAFSISPGTSLASPITTVSSPSTSSPVLSTQLKSNIETTHGPLSYAASLGNSQQNSPHIDSVASHSITEVPFRGPAQPTTLASEGTKADTSHSSKAMTSNSGTPTTVKNNNNNNNNNNSGQGDQPSALFVTIVSPNEDGKLETLIMTISEEYPWASLTPRVVEEKIKIKPEDEAATTAITAQETFTTSQSAASLTHKGTKTVNSTILVTITDQEFTSTLPVRTSVVTATSTRFMIAWPVIVIIITLCLFFMS